MNIVASCFQAPEEQTAIKYASERDEEVKEISYGELSRRVDDVLFSLKQQGLRPGDFIGIDMPMTPEAVMIYLAAVKGGMPVITVADSFSPGTNPGEVLLRLLKWYLPRISLPVGQKIPFDTKKSGKAEAPKTVVIQYRPIRI